MGVLICRPGKDRRELLDARMYGKSSVRQSHDAEGQLITADKITTVSSICCSNPARRPTFQLLYAYINNLGFKLQLES